MTDIARKAAEARYPYDYAREGDRLTAQQAFIEGAEWQAARTVQGEPTDAEAAAEHDRQVAERAWDEGVDSWYAAVKPKNPYRKEES